MQRIRWGVTRARQRHARLLSLTRDSVTAARIRFQDPAVHHLIVRRDDLRRAILTTLGSLAVALAVGGLFLRITHIAIRESSHPGKTLGMLPAAWWVAAVVLTVPLAVALAALAFDAVVACGSERTSIWHFACAYQPIVVTDTVAATSGLAIVLATIFVVAKIIAIVALLLMFVLFWLNGGWGRSR